MNTNYLNVKAAAVASVALLGAFSAQAGESAKSTKAPIAPAVEETPLCEKIFKATTFKFDNDIVNEFKIIGRYQGQYHWVDANQGNEDSYETRRWRIGAQAKMFNKKLKIKNNWNIDGLDDDGDDVAFDSIDEAVASLKVTDGFTLSAGKQKPEITREYSISSKKILTIERSAIVNQLTPEKAWGVHGEFGADKVTIHGGVYASQFEGEYDEWFDTDGGAFFLGSIGYELGEKQDIRLDYTYTDQSGNAAPGAENVVSLSYDGQYGDFRLIADVIGGFGGGTDVTGVVLLPSYKVTDKLEAVGRLQYSDGDVVIQKRYERRVADKAAEDYFAAYAGLNYYVCSHNLKFMAGVEYANATGHGSDTGFDGFTYLVGARLYF
ncbi:porin [Sulfuriroseicoccus oceanibius]|uniref:Outer membrane beta-barrel protein n=1 Tax=Sulfuriroseicoccus oceanibius TaxID=2707525 RepID=A0A6B3L798_9BACT|nr:porin [Sulfuriroseicoccus oceanibius]QQL46265.1 outer membrane beta-barrel protein [Sulfuriroseicoccus oceanibius]